jgi:hypothetical protein
MNNLMRNISISISSAIIISVFANKILNYNYLCSVSDKYIFDCMRNE